MTILEAIERAKRIRSEKASQGIHEPAGPERSERSDRTERSDRSDRTASRKRYMEAPATPLVRLEFERLPIDPAIYEKHRIIMPSDRAPAHSTVLDAYRMLRTRIWHRNAGAERLSSLGIVSAGPGEGKTLTALNLSLAFARDKRTNVFLLDLDLRNPCVCNYLGVTPKVDIGNALAGEAKPAEVFFGIGVDNLVLAGGSTNHANSSELLGGSGLTDLLGYIHGIDPNALILVDLPPVLLSADALVVAPKLSSVLLVVAEGITRRDQLDRAVDILAGAKVAGIVLNRSREAVEEYYG
jgi:protein-tyrosine kinase